MFLTVRRKTVLLTALFLVIGAIQAFAQQQGEIDWNRIFVEEGARWFHCGGIFAALSETTPEVAGDAGVETFEATSVDAVLHEEPALEPPPQNAEIFPVTAAVETQEPVAIAFLLDVSGSMRQVGKLDAAKDEELRDYIARREREIPAVDALNEDY